MKKLLPMLSTAIALGLVTGVSNAQHKLDNNLQQSSGGVNQQSKQIDYNARNALIYGNVSGGKGFRGNVGSSAPGDFRGKTGSDDLYRFRANSTPSISGQGIIRSQAVQRSSHSAILGNIRSNNLVDGTAIPASGVPVDAYRTGMANTTGQIIHTPEYGASQAGTLGIQGDLSGRSLGVGATSSMGLGVAGTPTATSAFNNSPSSTTTNLIGTLFSNQPIRSTLGSGVSATNNSLWRTDPEKNLAYPQSTAPAVEQILQPAQQSPSNLLIAQPANQPAMSMEAKAAQLQAQQIKLEASMSSNIGEDIYMKLQQAQINRERVAQGLEPKNFGADPANQLVVDPTAKTLLLSDQTLFNSLTGSQMDTNLPGNSGSGLSPVQRATTDLNVPSQSFMSSAGSTYSQEKSQSLTPEQKALIQQQRKDSMLQSRGVIDSNTILEQTIGMPLPSQDVQIQAKPTGGLFEEIFPQNNTDAASANLLNSMGVAPQTFGAQTPAALHRQWMTNRSMQKATEALKSGRYFNAERQFNIALLTNPQSFEASVGLLSSQLGAGMVRVTVMNLRKHLQKFPQRIGYKLDKSFLPPAKRLAWIKVQADNLMKQYGNYDAALLLAYVGYQTSDKQMLQYGLGLAQKHLSGDKLVADLSRAWLGQ